LVVYYINLDARTDRNILCHEVLSKLPYNFKRISAVSYRDVNNSDLPYKYHKILTAVKSSHRNAILEFTKSKSDYALILEDDFKPVVIDIEVQIEKLMRIMYLEHLNFLQLGFLEFGQSTKKIPLIKKFMFKICEFLYSRYIYFRNHGSEIIVGQVRWGAHSYIIDKKAARILLDKIPITNVTPLDQFYRDFARSTESTNPSINVGRVKRSVFEQNLTLKSDIQGVV